MKDKMKKRILLLSMPNTTFGFDRMSRMPNLGLCSIAGNIDEDLIDDIAIIDLVTVRSNIRKYVIKLLKSFKPDIVGLTAMSFQFQTTIEICKIIKELNTNIITVVGGYHVTTVYDTISYNQYFDLFDFIVRGEGEAAFNNLVKTLCKGNNKFNEIENLTYKQDGKFIHNPCGKILDLNQIKFPNRSIRLWNKYFTFGKRTDVIETSRGCTMSCNFCCMPSMYGRTFRKYPIERIVEDIKSVKANGTELIFIADDNAFINLKHMHNVCDAIIENGLNKIDYLIQASVHGIASDENLVAKMARAGFKLVFMGIENVSSNHLEFLSKDKKISSESEHAVRLLQKNNIIVAGGFIIGLPEDTRESIWQNYHFARRMKIDDPIISVITPYLNTDMRNNLNEQGLITNKDDLCFYDTVQTNIKTKNLSSEEITYIFWEMYSKYFDLEYLKFNQFRKVYPLFFWKLILKELPKTIWRWQKKILNGKANLSNYKASRKILIKDLKRSLLDRKEFILKRLKELDIDKMNN